MKVLSLFDGMACGALALEAAGIDIESYDAFEIDKYAIQTAQHNFPFIKHHGDVFKADFTQFKGVDLVCGGSPCTYWSIAQKNNRETEASGMGWELFQQYVRALKEAEPKYFIYENNKSMSKANRDSIDKAFGFEAVLINSALVSAQNRQRLYWVGKRNADGSYSKVNVEQPIDRGILLKDILESGHGFGESNGKSFCMTASYYKGKEPEKVLTRGERTHAIERVRLPEYGNDDKARPLNAHYSNNCGGFEHRMFNPNPAKQQVDMIAEPLNMTPDGKTYTVYKVTDGRITIKGKEYPIKLPNGYYIIRKLTVRECMRLQTVPEWYEFPVSDSQAYKMLGNGWTILVIKHLLESILKECEK
jgi:DNA (cytosine-5)-methyltransferase 3A